MTIVSFIAVLTNSTIIAFHSSWMEHQFKTFTKYDENDEENSKDRLLAARLGFILAFEVNCMKNNFSFNCCFLNFILLTFF